MDEEKTKDYKEELDQINEEETPVDEEKNIEEEIEQAEEKIKKNNKKLILVIITAVLLIACIVCVVLLIKSRKENKENTPEVAKIVRPGENEDYTILKQSYFNVTCKQTSKGEKYKKLYKGLLIDCVFGYELNSNQKVSELYFDLGNSANVKLNNVKNNSGHELLNEKNTYKLISKNPESALGGDIHFFYEVLNDEDETGYVEVSDVVFKDDNNKYYKAINSIETFPPEYDDKIYIYKDSYDEEEEGKVYYYSSRVKLEDAELFDTFQCKSETCESKAEVNNYFLIHDEDLIVYDTVKKTSNTLKLKDDVKINDYFYEIMLNPKGIIYGVAFKKEYVSAYDCERNQYVCVNTGLSGYEIGYYSMKLNRFTIDLDYGFIGSSAFNGYDVALMLKKDNQFGIFSYEDDNMMLELTDKYKSIDYDDNTEAIMLEVYDEANKTYYFEYFDPKYSQFTLDTDNLQKFDSSTLYYTTAFNQDGIMVTMLFDSKGNPLKNLPYAVSDKLLSVSDKIIIKNDLYEVYDLTGKRLYVSEYDPKYVLAYTESYIVTEKDFVIELLDSNGKFLVDVRESKAGVTFVSATEKEKGVLELIIKDASITEEGKNAYKYIIEYNKPFQTETIFVE